MVFIPSIKIRILTTPGADPPAGYGIVSASYATAAPPLAPAVRSAPGPDLTTRATATLQSSLVMFIENSADVTGQISSSGLAHHAGTFDHSYDGDCFDVFVAADECGWLG